MIVNKLIVAIALVPVVRAATGYCYTKAGVDTLTTMGKSALFGNPSPGDPVTDATKTMLEGAGKWAMVTMAAELCAAETTAAPTTTAAASGTGYCWSVAGIKTL